MRYLRILIIPFIYTFFYSTINSQNSYSSQLQSKIEKYCQPQSQDTKLRIFQTILLKLPASTIPDAMNVLDLILPPICFKDYPSWLVDRSYNLAIYAIRESHLKKTTVKYLTDIMPAISVGKADYISYGHIMENLLEVGVDKEFIFDLMHSALEQSYGPAGAEALAYYYTLGLLDKMDHSEALKNAQKETNLLRTQNDRAYILRKIYADEIETMKSKDKAMNAEKEAGELEKKYQKFWISQKHQIHIHEKIEKKESSMDSEKLKGFLTKLIGSQYGYRSGRNYSMDVTGMVSLITNTPTEKLPYTAEAYCSAQTIFSPQGLKTGDIMLMSIEPGSKDSYILGMYYDENQFLYSTITAGLLKADLNDPYFKKRFVKGCRILK